MCGRRRRKGKRGISGLICWIIANSRFYDFPGIHLPGHMHHFTIRIQHRRVSCCLDEGCLHANCKQRQRDKGYRWKLNSMQSCTLQLLCCHQMGSSFLYNLFKQDGDMRYERRHFAQQSAET